MLKRSIKNVLGCGLVVLLLSSCSSTPRLIEVSATPIDKPELTLPKVDRLEMRKVEWVIVTEENWEEVKQKIKKSGRPLALFSITDKGYANLGLNFSDIRALVQQQQTIIAAYESYYKNAEEALDTANKQVDSVNEEVKKTNNKPETSVLDKINPFK
jgi:hypothetical protein